MFGSAYAPLLLARAAELRAVSQLSKSQKDYMLPVFRLRPRPNSRSPEKILEVVEEAMDGSRFACDIDEWWTPTENGSGSNVGFREFKQANDPRSWYDFIESFESAIPCVRTSFGTSSIIEAAGRQAFQERGFGIVISPMRASHLEDIVSALPAIDTTNAFFVVDMSWSTDILQSAAAAVARCRIILTRKPNSVVYISGTSFPYSFSNFVGHKHISILEKQLFDQVREQIIEEFPEASIYYSDWATTRPPQAGGGGWNPRIDVPSWDIVDSYRADMSNFASNRQACIHLAEIVTSEENWPNDTPSWGHYMIELTADHSDFGIYTGNAATAARVNMHLNNHCPDDNDGNGVMADEDFDD